MRRLPFPRDVGELLCPRCGSEYLHQGSVEVHYPHGNGQATVTSVSQGAVSNHLRPTNETNIVSDRCGLLIGFFCENCRGPQRVPIPPHLDEDYAETLWLSIANVKGITEVGWVFERGDGELLTREPALRPRG